MLILFFGAVYDDLMGDALRVTVVATGLGQVAAARNSQKFEVVSAPMMQATGTTDAVAILVLRQIIHTWMSRRCSQSQRNVTVEALANSGVDRYDIQHFAEAG